MQNLKTHLDAKNVRSALDKLVRQICTRKEDVFIIGERPNAKTVLSNKATRNGIVLSSKDSPKVL